MNFFINIFYSCLKLSFCLQNFCFQIRFLLSSILYPFQKVGYGVDTYVSRAWLDVSGSKSCIPPAKSPTSLYIQYTLLPQDGDVRWLGLRGGGVPGAGRVRHPRDHYRGERGVRHSGCRQGLKGEVEQQHSTIKCPLRYIPGQRRSNSRKGKAKVVPAFQETEKIQFIVALYIAISTRMI